MVASSQPPDEDQVYDVVLVVEKTANLVPYLEELKTNYLLPTLEYFNGGPPSPIDTGHDYNCTLYCMVTYTAGDSAPELSSDCTYPTTSTHELIKSFDNLELVGGAGQSCSLVSEGLSTALQCLDEIKSLRYSGKQSQRHCILLCNSPPYHIVAEESQDYRGYNSEQLASMMGKRGVHLSIISPRKIPALQKLFNEAAAGDSYNSVQQGYYAVDPRHLVLLKGYQLQERSMSPSIEEEKKVLPIKAPSPALTKESNTDAFKKPGQTPVPQSMMQQVQVSQAVSSGSQPQVSTPQISANPAELGTSTQQAQTNSQKMMSQDRQRSISQQGNNIMNIRQGMNSVSQGMMNIPQAANSMVMSTQNSNSLINTQSPSITSSQPMGMQSSGPQNHGMIGGPGNQMTNNQQMANLMPGQQNQQSMIPGNQQNANMNSSQGMLSSVPGLGMGGQMPGSTNQSVGQIGGYMPDSSMSHSQLPIVPGPREKKIIWQGQMEYQDRSSQPHNQFLLNCHVYTELQDQEINTADWPQKLTIQLLPQKMLSGLQQLCKNSRQILFSFPNSNSSANNQALGNLYHSMDNGFAGAVRFTHSEIKIILVMYSGKKKSLVGIIPNDQNGLMKGIRDAVSRFTQPRGKPQQSAHAMSGNGAQGSLQMSGGVVASQTPVMMNSNQMPMQVGAGQHQAQMSQQPTPQQQQVQATDRRNMAQMSMQQSQQMAGMEQKKMIVVQQQSMNQNNQHQQIIGGHPNQQQRAQLQKRQLQMQMMQQQQQQQQQHQNTNPNHLRQMLMNQQQQQMRQQLLMQQQQMRGGAPQSQPGGMMGPGGQQGMQQGSMSQMNQQMGQPQQNFMEEFSQNIPDIL